MEFFPLLCVIHKRGEDNQPSDRYLIQKAKEGVRSAFDDLYNRYKKPIFSYIYRICGSREQSEELAQETFVRVYMNLATYMPKGKVSSWIYAIAGNLAKNELRSRAYRKSVSIDSTISEDDKITLGDILSDDSFNPSQIIHNNELKIRIQNVMQKLPLKHREVITLCDIGGLSYEEAAEIIGCSVGTIGSRLSRARVAFIKIFKEKFPVSEGEV